VKSVSEKSVADAGAPEPRRLLVVDDDDVFRSRVVKAFNERGFAALGAHDYDSAIAAARDDEPDMALVDLRLPGRSGLDVVRALTAADPDIVIVVMTGYGSIATAVESLKLGARNYLSKPADIDQILEALEGSSAGADADASVEVPSLARVEWEHIQRVLADCGGNISQAARLLGVHRRSLQRKLSKNPVSR
jgi:two-component system response regulator RegA